MTRITRGLVAVVARHIREYLDCAWNTRSKGVYRCLSDEFGQHLGTIYGCHYGVFPDQEDRNAGMHAIRPAARPMGGYGSSSISG